MDHPTRLGEGFNAAITEENGETLELVAKLLSVNRDDLKIRLTKNKITVGKEIKFNGITTAKVQHDCISLQNVPGLYGKGCILKISLRDDV